MATLPRLYKLVDRRIVRCKDQAEWDAWFRTDPDREVAQTRIDELRIGTAFIGVGLPEPWLFQTMVFAEGEEGDVTSLGRGYSLWAEAEAGHAEIVRHIREEMDISQVKASEAWATVFSRYFYFDVSEMAR